ncbi:MAG: PKD-like domain-containing protein [Brumimicrobium sp.]|nr:PKD-like domain-containing protein [Brumimicrobium sp.]
MFTITSSRFNNRKLFGGRNFIAVFVAFFSLGITFSQEHPQDGMFIKEKNFTSFSTPKQTHIEHWTRINDKKFYDHPDFGFLPENAPCTECVEDLSKREQDLRYYIDINDPSRYYVQKAQGLLHHKINGEWKTIDYKLKPVSNNEFLSDFHLDKVKINAAEKTTQIITKNGTLSLNNWKLFKKVEGQEVFVADANWSDFTAGEDGLYVKGVFSGIDAELIITPGGIKTNFIIKNANYGNYESLIFRDELKMTDGQTLSAKLKSSESLNTGVDEIIISSNGSEIAEFGEAVAYGRTTSRESVRNLEYILNGSMIDIVVPAVWIEKYKNQFDLVIDPQVTGSNTLALASITGSQYNASCNFTNSCNQFLTVPAPANATFDNVLWTFTYEAKSICWLSDGAVRFTTGACVSPATSGFYWYCNTNTGGTCAGNNISIFSDLGGCLPAPSCSPQNVNFTMQFFRKCYGSTGCNNTCIGAFTPWTMTITGQTINYTNTSNPITLSATSVCQGQSLNASTTAQNGVPPYTYNWSFNASGTPSVGTGASTSITFPTAGTVTLYSIVTDNCGNQTTASRTVTVHPTPTVSASPNTQTICSGSSTGISLSGTPAGVAFNWTVSQTNVTGASGGSGNNIAQTLSTSTGGNAVYTITPTANGCTGSPINVTVNVEPVPTVSASPNTQTICSGQTTGISLSGTPASTTFSWTASPTNVSGSSGGSGNSIAQTLTSASGGNVVYTITPSNNGCNGTPINVTVNVNALPTPTITGPSSYCQGQSASLSATAGFASYNWSNGAMTQNTTVTTANNPITVTVTDGNGCSGTSAPFNVTENPIPTVTPSPTSQTICDGGTTGISLSGTPSGVTFSWTASPTNVTGASGSSGNSIAQTLNSSSGGNVVYTITPSANGCTGSPVNVTVDVAPNPTPTITGASTYCAGNSANISAPAGFSSYNWSNGANTQNTSVTDADNPITVTVTDANGCTGTSATFTVTEQAQINYAETIEICQGQSAVIHGNTETVAGMYQQTFTTSGCDSVASITLVVNSLPNVTASATNNPICANGSTTVSASGASSYTWDNSLGSGSSHSVSPASNTTYTVTGTDANGCQNTDQITITVNPLPTVNAGTDITVCENNTVTLQGSGTATSYSWDNGVSDGVAFTPSLGTTTYTVTGTDANGCQNTDQIDVTVQTSPTVDAGNDTTLCENASLTLTGSGNAVTYSWDNGVTDGTSFIPPVGTTVYTVTGSSGPGCQATDQISVTVNPAPTVDAGTDQNICLGDEITLTGSGNADIYNWDNGVSNGTPFTPGLGIVTYTVTGENSTTGCTSTDQVTITVNPLPTVDAGADLDICEGEAVTLTGSGTATNYTWDNGVIDGQAFTPGVGSTVYTVTGTDANGCENTATVTVNVTPQPTASFTALPTSGQAPLNVDFTNNSSGGNSYVWDFGNGETASSVSPTNQNNVYTSPGVYEVTLMVTNGNCSDISTLNIVVENLPLSYTIPNIITPNGDESNDVLQMNIVNAKSVYIEVFNRWGNLVGVVDSLDPSKGWDGTDHKSGEPVTEGVYFYTYKIVGLNDEEFEGHQFLHLER